MCGELRVDIYADKFENFKKIYRFPVCSSAQGLEKKREEKRCLKIALYRTLVFLTGINLPYGCLTGIRPTKLFSEYGENARQVFLQDFSVSERKVDLIERTTAVQSPVRNRGDGHDVFVFIPFCPTRCAYCSFISLPLDRQKKLVEPYVEKLIEEIDLIKHIVKTRNIDVRSVYVGGGTPTSISPLLLDRILKSLTFDVKEFTVEAGRPDTLSEDIVGVLSDNGVNRISVNPQTFNDKTLQLIGRRHTCADFERAYALAENKFDINTDLIAMLPGESFEDFAYSVDKAAEYNPANVTVHTLYLKKGSALKAAGYKHADYDTAVKMVDYAYDTLSGKGYSPYYMYRQKYTGGNLENVGYAKAGKECVYNVDIMEEDTSILAAGAAAISKKLTKSINLIERNANFKEPLEYIKHFDTVIKRQKQFWLGE